MSSESRFKEAAVVSRTTSLLRWRFSKVKHHFEEGKALVKTRLLI